MKYLTQTLVIATVGFLFGLALSIEENKLFMLSAGMLGAASLSLLYLVSLFFVKLASQLNQLDSKKIAPPTSKRYSKNLLGFDAEGKLMIYSKLWNGGK